MAQQSQTVEIPHRLPLVIEPENRSTTTDKDAKLVNGYIETHITKEEKQIWIYKRPGTAVNTTLSGNGYGMYNWKGDIYSAFGTKLYKNGANLGTIDATNGVYRFSQSLGTPNRLVLGNGVKAYTYDGTTFAVISDADFPAAFVKGWAYLDTTTYVMTAAAAIQGSGLNDPTSWDPLNSIIAQIEPDGGVALGKQLVYVAAFKQWTTEFFYDAANATGSPLGPVQGAKCNYGCASAETVQDIDGILIWVTTTRQGSAQVATLDGLKVEIVSSKPVERMLKGVDFSSGIFSWTYKSEGHSFYVLTCKAANFTIAYDLRERMWSQWTDSNGNYLPIVASCATNAQVHLVQHETNGKIYTFDLANTSDDGTVFPVDIYTPNFDGGNRRYKHMNMMELIGDQVAGSTIQVRHNDHDYDPTKWSSFRTFYMDRRRPMLTGFGSFKRRAHHFRHKSNTRMRIQAVGMQLDLGTL